MRKQFKEIILRYGELQQIASELQYNRNTVRAALQGKFFEDSRNYNSCIAIRRYTLDKFPGRYAIKQ